MGVAASTKEPLNGSGAFFARRDYGCGDSVAGGKLGFDARFFGHTEKFSIAQNGDVVDGGFFRADSRNQEMRETDFSIFDHNGGIGMGFDKSPHAFDERSDDFVSLLAVIDSDEFIDSFG